jgi:hypothetical protein
VLGLAYASNGISGANREYLSAGGNNFFCGDGRLPTHPKSVLQRRSWPGECFLGTLAYRVLMDLGRFDVPKKKDPEDPFFTDKIKVA